MRKLNLYFGILLFLGFLGTGAYLMLVFKPQNLTNLPARMEIRANHIYILFIALLNIFSYGIPTQVSGGIASKIHLTWRGFLVAAGIAAVMAFFSEHAGTLTGRSLTFYAVVLSLSAAVFYLVALFMERKRGTP